MKSSLLTVIIAMLFLFSCVDNSIYNKPSIIAGYKSGTFFDVHLLMFADSTFYFSNSDEGLIGNWKQNGDTIIFEQRDAIQAKLVNFQFESQLIVNPTFNYFKGMRFIENNPAKVVKFPKHN